MHQTNGTETRPADKEPLRKSMYSAVVLLHVL